MTRITSALFVLLALVACKAEEPQKGAGAAGKPAAAAAESGKPDPLEDAVRGKRAAVFFLRKEVVADAAAWPKDKEPELDFGKQTGNAIVVHAESGRHADPLDSLTRGAAFKLFHIEDDPYRLAFRAYSFLNEPEEQAKYRTAEYKPALEQLIRAKYVLFVVGKVEQPQVAFAATKSFTPGRLEAAAVLYEIESKKLLGGFPLEARNSDKVNAAADSNTQAQEAVLRDFENNAREALWKGLKGRFPSAKVPAIAYLNSKED
jgi:hypothetical protein